MISGSVPPGTLWGPDTQELIYGSPSAVQRNDYTGWVGTALAVGVNPITLTDLGRWVVSGNSGSHTVKLVTTSNTDVSGGSVSVNTSGATSGQFVYAPLAAPVLLAANTTYYVVSQESTGIGADKWFDTNTSSTASLYYDAGSLGAGISGCVYGSGSTYTLVTATNQSFGPVGLKGLIRTPQRTNEQVIVRNNRIVNVDAGINAMGANLLIEGNTIANVVQAVNSDTSGNANTVIVGNHFENVGRGIVLGTAGAYSGERWYWDGIVIADNFFELNDSASTVTNAGYKTAAISFRNSVENAVIANNTVQLMPAFRGSIPGGTAPWYSFWIGQVSGYTSYTNKNISIVGNSIAPGLVPYLGGGSLTAGQAAAQVTYAAGNHTLDGYNSDYAIIPAASLSVPTSGDLIIDPTPSAHQWTDRIWIATSSNGGTNTIHLPDPVLFEGRKYRLHVCVSPVSAATTVAFQCGSNTYCPSCPAIWDVKTQSAFTTTQSLIIGTWPASSAYPLTPVTVTSIGGGWKLERP